MKKVHFKVTRPFAQTAIYNPYDHHNNSKLQGVLLEWMYVTVFAAAVHSCVTE